MITIAEQLRLSMRHWPTGVAVVTSQYGQERHGMTVNSFTSLSLLPPVVSVSLAHDTRTCKMLLKSGVLAITLLAGDQAAISERFAGHVAEEGDRFEGLEVFTLASGAPFLTGGTAFLDCRVRAWHVLELSTLFLLDVIAVQSATHAQPLVYFNRGYHHLP